MIRKRVQFHMLCCSGSISICKMLANIYSLRRKIKCIDYGGVEFVPKGEGNKLVYFYRKSCITLPLRYIYRYYPRLSGDKVHIFSARSN